MRKSYLLNSIITGIVAMSSLTVIANEATVNTESTLTATETVNKDYPVTLEFIDTKIQDVLSIMSEQRPSTSILVDPAVQGNVSINLKDVPWLQAFKLIVNQHNLEYDQVGDDIFQVRPKKSAIAATVAAVEVELYKTSDFEKMDDELIKKMYLRLPTAREDMTIEQIRKEYTDGNITIVKKISADQQPAISILQALAKAADLNFSFAGDITKLTSQKGTQPGQPVHNVVKMSLNLTNQSLERTLLSIANRGGFTCVLKDDVWEISERQPAQQQPLELGHFEVNFIPIDTELLNVLRSIVSKRGKITAGKNKMIVVMATEEELEDVRTTLAVMDKPTPQVMIESRIFELNQGESDYIGVDWSTALGSEGTTISGDFNYADQAGGLATDTGFLRTSTFSVATMSAAIHALEDDNGAKQLANPKIIVTSGEQATIHIGEKEPIFKATSSGSGESAERTYELDSNFGKDSSKIANLTGDETSVQDAFNTQGTPGYLDLGTLLTVAPTVKTEDQVYIKVIPNLTRKIGSIRVGSESNTVEYPKLFSTKVYTEFTISSGQTIALGGLTKEQSTESELKVPFLGDVFGDIPVLGGLFKYQTKEVVVSETVIFLTVKVEGAKDLKLTSGVPITSRLVDGLLADITEQDAKGAVYTSDDSVPEENEINIMEGREVPETKSEATEKEGAKDAEVPVVEGNETIILEKK